MTEKRKKFFRLRLMIFLLYFLMPLILLIFIYEPMLLSFINLEKIIIKTGSQNLAVIRDKENFDVMEGMELKPGDKIENKGDSTIEITIRAIQLTADNGIILKQATVMLNKNTEITIQNTSLKQKPYGFISLEKGDIYIETERYPFSVETTYITAGTKGTKFLVKVEPGDKVTVAVSEGIILLESKPKKWTSLDLESPAQCTVIAENPPEQKKVDKYEIEKELEWIRDVQKIATSKELLWRYPLAGLVSNWYIRMKLNELAKKESIYMTINNTYTNRLSELKLDPGPLSIQIRANANYFEANATYKLVPGYIWMIDSDGQIGFFKDPYQDFPQTKISILSIILFTALFALIARFIRYRVKSRK